MVEEKVSGKKFWSGMLNFLNPVLWLKDLVSIFNIRKIIIYLVILGIIFGYGYWKGMGNRPLKLNLKYGKEVNMRLENNRYLHLHKDGQLTVEDKDGNIINTIKVKDVPRLNKVLKPYGFQLKPILVAGGGTSKDGQIQGEVGAGISFFRAWKMELDAFITSCPAIYGGTSYSVTDNFSVGVGVGTGLKKFDVKNPEIRAILYGKFKF